MAILKNRAGVATPTVGTGTMTVGAALTAAQNPNAASWQTPANAGVVNGDIVRYLVLDSNGAWEYGLGTYSSTGPTVTRAAGSMNGSVAGQKSSTGALLALSGTAQIFIAAIAEDIGDVFLAANNVFTGTNTFRNGITLSTAAALTLALMEEYSATVASTLLMRRSKSNTLGAHTAVAFNDILGSLQVEGSNGTSFLAGGRLDFIATSAPGGSGVPSKLTVAVGQISSGASVVAAVFSPQNGQFLLGAIDGSSAAAGQVGETLGGNGGVVACAAGAATSLATISLSPGDWDVWGWITGGPGSTTASSYVLGLIGTVISSGGAGQVYNSSYAGPSGDVLFGLVPFVARSASVQTYYVNIQPSAAGNFIGNWIARRVR